MRPRGKHPRQWIDVAICGALIGFGLWGITLPTHDETGGGHTAVDNFVLPAAVLPILLRWRAPLLAAAAFAVGVVVSAIPTFDQVTCGFVIPSGLLILYAISSRLGLGRALRGFALVLAGLSALFFVDAVFRDDPVGAGLFLLTLVVVVWTAGRLVFSRDRVAEQLAERSRLLERQREQTARMAVEVERTRVAADIDVSARVRVRRLIDLAETGERVLADDPERSRRLFARIERDGRESLNELRSLLGILRSDERGARAPRPTLAQIETLLEEARAGGRLVDLEVEGERRPLPGGVELAAYRALQHALVVVDGSDGIPARVHLRYLTDALELEVSGLPTAGADTEAALIAARERVTTYGGRFSFETPRVGRRVLAARLPLATHG